MKTIPRFAIVGHPNKGKSSIVSTLIHNDNIAINELSGTTVQSQSYPFSVNGHTLYELFDTPGFQRPRQALSWISAHAEDASQRVAAVKTFIKEHKATAAESGKFRDEVELLSPISLEGAGIIYVVDGSVPYTPEYEAEMTILQWTGQPRMALINPISGETHVEEWKQALGQFFSLVKVFNPMTADLEKQLAVLNAFKELTPEWKNTLEKSLTSIQDRNARLLEQSAYIIAERVADLLSFQTCLPLISDSAKQLTENTVKQTYQKTLRKKETGMRKAIAELFMHSRLQCQEQELETDYPDLFDEDFWYIFGLTRKKLVGLSAAAGAAAGAVLDAGIGGASFMAGSVLGGIAGGSSTLFFTQKPDKVSIKGMSLAGKQLCAGPIKNIQFAFVILGRAIAHQQAVSQRPHADHSVLQLDEVEKIDWINKLSQTQQAKLTRLLQKSHKGLSLDEIGQFKKLIIKIIQP